MKRYLILIACLIFCGEMKGQNLVPNPSFEIYDTCPTLAGQIFRAIGWNNYGGDAEYFNSCDNLTIYAGLGVPVNNLGNQIPVQGNAYVGIVPYASNQAETREFFGRQLSQSLIIGQNYFVSFYISLADTFSLDCAINKMGMKFSTIPYSINTPPPLTNSAHVYTNSIITDKINWTKISGWFMADSTYDYIIIGNFFDDAHTDTANCAALSYYYVDMVCVSTDSLTCANNGEGIPESKYNPQFNIFPNPATNQLTIKNTKPINTYILSNAFGQIIKEGKMTGDETTLSVSGVPTGIYILALDGRSFYKVIVVH